MSESQHFILRVRYTVIGRGPQLTLPPSGPKPNRLLAGTSVVGTCHVPASRIGLIEASQVI